MSSVNKVIIIGRVGKDPEIRAMQNGKSVASFSVACSENWKDKSSGERKEKTEWINVVIFSKGLVGVVESYVKKGSQIYVEGKLQTRKWQDKNGNDKYTTEVVLQDFGGTLQLLDKRESSSNGQANRQAPANDLDDSIPDFDSGDIPF